MSPELENRTAFPYTQFRVPTLAFWNDVGFAYVDELVELDDIKKVER